jgi:hypothetical protein
VSQLRGFIRVSDDSFADHPGVIGWELESKCQVRPTLRVVESFSCLTTNETEIKSMLVSPPR